jgi:ABC-type polysaccharide/polyol phosphate export permease
MSDSDNKASQGATSPSRNLTGHLLPAQADMPPLPQPKKMRHQPQYQLQYQPQYQLQYQLQLSWRQIRAMTAASIKSRYRNTIAGLIWVVLSPVLLYTAQAFAFRYVLKINFENYPLFLVTGLIPWIFLIQSIAMGTTLFTTQARMFKSFPIHPLACLIAMLMDNLVNFTLAFFVILIPVALKTAPGIIGHFVLFPLPMLSIFIAAVGFSWMLATLQVFFHDTRYVVEFITSIAFYITPIFYPSTFVDEQYRWILDLNPLVTLFYPLQALARDQIPSDFWMRLLSSYAISLTALLFASIFWSRKRAAAYFNL